MAAHDKQNGNAKGFSGLSTLVSDVDEGSPARQPTPQVTPPPSRAPVPESPPRQVEESQAASTVLQASESKSDGSSDVATGKWMVGIGLGIGLLLIAFVNSTKNEPTPSAMAPVAQAPVSAVPTYSPPTVAPVTQSRQAVQETVIEQRAATVSVNVLGQQVLFSIPHGYCTPGESAREVELMDLAKRSLAEVSRLVHVAVLCSELDEYRIGRRDMLDHWLQIQLIGLKGNFQRIEMPREAFLSGAFEAIPRVANSAEFNRRLEASVRRLEASVENSDVALTDIKFEPIGRDGNAVYVSMRMNMRVGDRFRPISGVGAITLVNSLPLSINVYEGTGSPQSRAQLQAILQELLNTLLAEN